MFIVKGTELSKNSLAPIKYRLTYNKRRKDFSTGIRVNPEH